MVAARQNETRGLAWRWGGIGGGKAAVVYPDTHFDRAALLSSHGRTIDALGGVYVTG